MWKTQQCGHISYLYSWNWTHILDFRPFSILYCIFPPCLQELQGRCFGARHSEGSWGWQPGVGTALLHTSLQTLAMWCSRPWKPVSHSQLLCVGCSGQMAWSPSAVHWLYSWPLVPLTEHPCSFHTYHSSPLSGNQTGHYLDFVVGDDTARTSTFAYCASNNKYFIPYCGLYMCRHVVSVIKSFTPDFHHHPFICLFGSVCIYTRY